VAFLLLDALTILPDQENAFLRVSGGKKYHLAKSGNRQGACSGWQFAEFRPHGRPRSAF
jgi:hypothetical protein